MRFCNRCGSYMELTPRGFLCPQCGNEQSADVIEVNKTRESDLEPVYVVRVSRNDSARVNQICPMCGNNEAYRRVSLSLGEHAGVKQERTVEHFKCTKCSHSWTKI